MNGALVASLWMLLTPPPDATATPPDIVRTQPGPVAPKAEQPAPIPPSDAQPEAPQTSEQPDIAGGGAIAQQQWEARLHAAYDTAEARQGPLDGRWRISGAQGDDLFVIVLSDPGGFDLVGAWRDARKGGVDGSGYLSSVNPTAEGLDLRFTEPGQSDQTVLRLHLTTDGHWSGELTGSGAVRPVVMTRF